LFLFNIPEIRGDLQARITIYQPYAKERLQFAKDTAEPALFGILSNIAEQSKTTIANNGTVTRVLKPAITENVDTSNTWTLDRKSSITADQFNAVLEQYQSPATGVGAEIVSYANSKNIDAAYILYMFIHESSAGTNPNWIGIKPDGSSTKNPGNVICAGYTPCYQGFREYPTWSDGFKGMIDNLESYKALGDKTIDQGINRWAPPTENNTTEYVASLKNTVETWRKANSNQIIATANVIGKTKLSKSTLVPSDATIISIPLKLDGCLADTVPNALNPSKGLQDIIIKPNEDWSFNEHWNVVDEEKHYCAGVQYGGVCDMAARYNNAARLMGLTTLFQQHPGLLAGIGAEDNVVIWSLGSYTRGGQDLIIKNETNRIAYLKARIDNNTFTVTGWYE